MHYYMAATILLIVSVLAGALSSVQRHGIRGKFSSFILAAISLAAGILLSVVGVLILAGGDMPQAVTGTTIWIMVICAAIPGCLGILLGHAMEKRSATKSVV